MHRFDACVPDPRLAELLAGFPAEVFSARLYRSCELIDRYSVELAVGLTHQLDIAPHLESAQRLEQLEHALGFAPGFRPALTWLLERLALAGELEVTEQCDARTFRANQTLRASESETLRQRVLEADPANAPTLNLIDAAAAVYLPVAHGASAEKLLLDQGLVPLWLEYFHNDNPPYAVNNWLSAESAVSRLASHRHLRILEVGAGAGSASLALLATLDRAGRNTDLERYQVTEPNPFFRRRGSRSFAEHFPAAPVELALLDIDKPWAKQGAPAASFDLVYAVNVLHTAKDLLFSLSEARSVLKPDGWLVAGECLRPFPGQPMWPEFVFQLLHDFLDVQTDPHYRPNPGFLTPSQWCDSFIRAGFPQVSVTPDPDSIAQIYTRFFTGAICAQMQSAP